MLKFIFLVLLLSYCILVCSAEPILVDISSANKNPVTLNCSKPTVVSFNWTYNGEDKNTNSSVFIISNSHDVGNYTCSYGTSAILYTAINFTDPVIIHHGEKSMTVTEGDSDITVKCTSKSSTPLTYTWFKQKEGEAEENLSLDGSRYSIINNGRESDLVIRSVDMDTRAYYKCVVKQDLTEAKNGSARILIRVQGKLAPLWAFLAICGEVAIMAIITLAFAARKKKEAKASLVEQTDGNNPSTSGMQQNTNVE